MRARMTGTTNPDLGFVSPTIANAMPPSVPSITQSTAATE
jgi:hypothetical protein